jgi:NADH:ubiquinone oxidoreductase subunit C
VTLPDPAAAIVRGTSAAFGEVLLLDARRGRALFSDSGKLLDVCKALRRGGFSRAVDYTAMDTGSADLQIGSSAGRRLSDVGSRSQPEAAPAISPAHAVATPTSDLRPSTSGVISTEKIKEQDADLKIGAPTFAFFLTLRAPAMANCALVLKWKWNFAGQAHPSLGAIWASAGLAEREIFEMLGVPFSGNDNLKPLLLDARFQGFPLRRDFTPPPPHAYGAALLQDRHEDALVFGLRQASDYVGATLASPGQRNVASDAKTKQTASTVTGDASVAPTNNEEAAP